LDSAPAVRPAYAEVLGTVRLALFLVGYRRSELIRKPFQLPAQDMHVPRRVDRDRDAVPLHAADFDKNIVANADSFSRLSAEH
jgi:hypothetical protein